MENQRFRPEDIKRWGRLHSYRNENHEKDKEYLSENDFFDIKYADKELSDIILPLHSLSHLLATYKVKDKGGKLFPVVIEVDRMNMADNWWWKDEPCMWLGDKDGNAKLLINPDKKGELHTLRLLSTILGGFRWKMLRQNENLRSVVFDQNQEKWFEWMEKKTNHSRNTLNHVFFEVTSYSIACKLFACEILEIPYVSGKFTITDETLDFLESDKWVVGKRTITVHFEDGSQEVVETDVLHKETLSDTLKRAISKARDLRMRRDKKLTTGVTGAYTENGSGSGGSFFH